VARALVDAQRGREGCVHASGLNDQHAGTGSNHPALSLLWRVLPLLERNPSPCFPPSFLPALPLLIPSLVLTASPSSSRRI
jgi:hypothetical protein